MGTIHHLKSEAVLSDDNQQVQNNEKPKSQYRGVYWDNHKNGWIAVLYKGRYKYESPTVSSKDWHAAVAFDVLVFRHNAPRKLLNFPEKAQMVEQRVRESMGIYEKPQLKLVK